MAHEDGQASGGPRRLATGPSRLPVEPRRLPVAVVAGFAGAGKSALIGRWLRERPEAERWALLGNASTEASPGPGDPPAGGAPALPGTPRAADAQGAVGRYRVAGGCACCTAQASARSALVALLRAGPWHRLIVELDGAARPEALIDLLQRPPFDALLEVDCIVAVVDAARPAPYESEPMHPLARSQVEVSTHIVLNNAERLAEARREALVRRLADAPPFGRSVELTVDTPASSSPGPDEPAPNAQAGASASSAPSAAALAQWRRPAHQVFHRARLQALAADWPARHPLAQATGVFRTARDWYIWRLDGSASIWEACAYRLGNRLRLAFTAGTPAHVEAAALASIAADLGRAIDHDRDEA